MADGFSTLSDLIFPLWGGVWGEGGGVANTIIFAFTQIEALVAMYRFSDKSMRDQVTQTTSLTNTPTFNDPRDSPPHPLQRPRYM